MMRFESRVLSLLAAAVAVALSFAVVASSATAATKIDYMRGFDAPETPADLDRVGVLKQGPRKAENVLVFSPGTSASAAYARPLSRLIVRKARRRTGERWQVWSVERRENLLEDQSVVDRVKQGKAGSDELFDYYLGYLTDPSITDHYETVPDSEVGFAREWGMRVAVEDLRRVIRKAGKRGGEVVLGGHSLGGTITTAYATWDFKGKPGAKGLSGLVYMDGGSNPAPISPEDASQELAELQGGSPWLTFGGIPAPLAGLFNVVGSTTTRVDPNSPSQFQTWPLAPANLLPPVPATNEGQYGYALDADTSPPGLAAAQVNAGRLAASGDPRGWVRDGEITPIQRVAKMFSGTGILGHDGTSWYHPQRLTTDSGAVAAGNANPAQQVLDVHAVHGDDVKAPIYAFGAALGGQRVLDAAQALADQSGIPDRKLKLVNRQDTYAHVDPLSAYAENTFVKKLAGFLKNKVK